MKIWHISISWLKFGSESISQHRKNPFQSMYFFFTKKKLLQRSNPFHGSAAWAHLIFAILPRFDAQRFPCRNVYSNAAFDAKKQNYNKQHETHLKQQYLQINIITNKSLRKEFNKCENERGNTAIQFVLILHVQSLKKKLSFEFFREGYLRNFDELNFKNFKKS